MSGWVRLFHCGVGKGKEVKRTGGQGVQASLLGVGAPEALVIGVVALLVFGPKGLAEVWGALSHFLLSAAPSSSSLRNVHKLVILEKYFLRFCLQTELSLGFSI